MTQEEKELVLKDLCARLPYGVSVLYDNGLICQPSGLTRFSGQTCISAFGVIDPMEIEKVKSYLRPMSSMTDEELIEYEDMCDSFRGEEFYELIDWLNSNHFDYRGLIDKSLALEASEDMYSKIN